ncbi:hypothetical protein KXQ82_02640 [Mucilaginibacter sp. HMF5004]|uniref:hypothetical protein n=1 Tax=Mucilaginibacter rivuli TaxID=2857527 RepID=UPI001C5FFB24|nr:hypothetical protein [Mucilaginibacter rivuli]MBW4888590.1 hypothetical protein [Mucilaginibacter rivuli]
MKLKYLLPALLITAVFGCKHKDKPATPAVYKGLYSFGPEVKSFKDCETGSEFWATDSSATLELQYSQLNFAKPYEPVYVEVEGDKVKASKADGLDAQYDSILVVKKLVKITKVIPPDMCN